MKIAIGATMLAHGLENGCIDGIGTYTQQLLFQYKTRDACENLGPSTDSVTPYVFQRFLARKQFSAPFKTFPDSFERAVMQSVLSNLPMRGNKSIKTRYDLFHASDHYIPKLKGIPLLTTLMDPIPLLHPEWVRSRQRKLKNWLFQKTIHWADHYVTISDYVVNDLVTCFNIPHDKITVIHLGVDPSFFQCVSLNDKQKILEKFELKKPFFLFIGTIQPRKNLNRIIDAYCSLPHDIQMTHQLVVAGQYGWNSDKAIKRLEILAQEGKALWLNYVSTIEKQVLLQSAKALIFPSLYEGFGLPVLEAFASNLPVITSNTTALPEVAGSAALLVDPLSREELSQAMIKVTIDESFANQLREKGKKRAQQFTWQKTAEETWRLYQTLIK